MSVGPAATSRPVRPEPLALRKALGAFATGVAVVSTQDATGGTVAITINSFSPVSLEPPLVLWSVRTRSARHAVFSAARTWTVNILRQPQLALACRFAQRDAGPAQDLPWVAGEHGTPRLADALAWFECRSERVIELGDHSVLVGEVLAMQRTEGEPLLFFSGQYREYQDRPLPAPASA